MPNEICSELKAATLIALVPASEEELAIKQEHLPFHSWYSPDQEIFISKGLIKVEALVTLIFKY